MWKQETKGSFLMDICLRDSCLIWHCWQKNFWSAAEPNLSGLVNRSKHPIRVDIPQLWVELVGPTSLLRELWGFVEFVFVGVPWLGSKSNEMSTHGSYVVDVKPHAVHMTSDRKMPENTLCAIQQSPLPALLNSCITIYKQIYLRIWKFKVKVITNVCKIKPVQLSCK